MQGWRGDRLSRVCRSSGHDCQGIIAADPAVATSDDWTATGANTTIATGTAIGTAGNVKPSGLASGRVMGVVLEKLLVLVPLLPWPLGFPYRKLIRWFENKATPVFIPSRMKYKVMEIKR